MKLTKNDIKQKRAELVEVLLEIGGLTSEPPGSDVATEPSTHSSHSTVLPAAFSFPSARRGRSNLLAPITSANKLRVRFVPGSAYKLDGKDFSFHNVTESESVPEITDVVPTFVGAEAA